MPVGKSVDIYGASATRVQRTVVQKSGYRERWESKKVNSPTKVWEMHSDIVSCASMREKILVIGSERMVDRRNYVGTRASLGPRILKQSSERMLKCERRV